MPVQTSAGNLQILANDLQITHRGKTIAIKIRDMGYPVIIGCERQADGSWRGTQMLYEEWANSGVTPESDIAKHGNAVNFVRNVLRPAINAWLARLFPAISAPAPAPSGSAIEQIDAAVLGLKFVAGADGTLRVE